jgi:hypothetical protein
MNIHNQLIPSQIHSTTPIKLGETTTATLKEKISDSKAILIIKGQEFQAEFTNDIPKSEKITLKVLNLSENSIQVESKESLKSSLNAQSNNSLHSIETGKMISNPKISDSILSIMKKKGLQPDTVINNHIKEALSGRFDEHLNRLKKDVLNAIQNEIRVTTNTIKNERNPGSVVKQVNDTLNRIAPFINPQTSEELNALSKELNVNLSKEKLQIVKDRLIRVLQQVDADIQESVNKAGKENIFQVESEIPNFEPKKVVRQTREHVQQLPTVTKALEKTQEMLKSISLAPKSIEKFELDVQETKQYQQLGKEQLGKERFVQALQQLENELPEVKSNKTEMQLKEVVRQTREQVHQTSSVNKAIEKTQDLIKSIPFESKSIERLERAVQGAKQYQKLGKDQIGKERIIKALQQIENELPEVKSSKTEMQLKEVVRQTRNQVQQSPTVTKAIEKTQDLIKSFSLEPKSVEKLERAVQEARQNQQLGREQAGKERITQVLQQVENELPEQSVVKKTESQSKEIIRQIREQVHQTSTVTKAIEKTQDFIKSIPLERKSIEKLVQAFQEAKQYQQLGKEQLGKERIVQSLQQIENELSEVSTSKSELSTKEVVRQTKEQVQQISTVTKAIEKTQDMLKSFPLEPKSVEKLERAVQEAKQYQHLGREQLGKEKIVQALQQIENELPEVSTSKNELQLKETVRQTREQVQQAPTVSKAVEKTQELINSLPHATKMVVKLESAIQVANHYQQQGKEQAGKERVVQALQQLESELQIETPNKNSQNDKIANQTINMQFNSKDIQVNSNEAELEKITLQNKTEITKQAVDQWMNMIQKQGKMNQALDLLQAEIDKYPESAPVKKVMESMERAAQHIESKKELAARKEIHETLQQLKPNLPSESTENHEMQSINEEMKSFIKNSPLLASASKDIVVTKVTEKLAKATTDFKEVQRELIRNLNNVDNMLRTQHTQPQARQLLESTISKLDNSILKSEMMILSDMGTEKKLIQASSQLAEAKKLLSSGNSFEAQKIVQNVSKLLEKINWKPSEVKVMHYTNGLSNEQPVPHYEKQLTKTISNIANYTEMEYGSPREMYEKLRSMGLNYERDIGNYFASNKPEHQLKELETNNLKYLLQKISSEDGTGKFVQQIEQTLSNITGQQLLSKSDHQANQQSMMFSLPVQLEQQMKNIKVFVNSKKDGQKVDWENCSLYFLIDTPKLGEVGIHVSAADRKLSLTLKNNSYDFEQVAKPIGEKAIQKIEEIGYRVNGMKFTNLRSEPASQKGQVETTPEIDFANYFTEKGMNFTI